MAINRISCPECSAGLKSGTGFSPGQTVCCPKCETYFVVEEPADEVEEEQEKPARSTKGKGKTGSANTKGRTKPDDGEEEDDYEPPRKKKKKKRSEDDDDERSYKNSPVRYGILTVLVVIMLVGLYFLIQKYRREHEEVASNDTPATSTETPAAGPGTGAPPLGVPGTGRGPRGPGVVFTPGGVRPPGVPPGTVRKVPTDDPAAQRGGVVSGGLLGPDIIPSNEAKQLLQKYQAQLMGTWKADLGGGVTAQLVYAPDHTVIETVTGPAGTRKTTGKWNITGLVNRRSVTIELMPETGAARTEKLVFEDDELLQPVPSQSVTGVFRKSE
jgi:uncharacterized Zn finger protein (UPF0148 family)